MITRECPNCGKLYLANPTRLKHRRELACSKPCSYELRAKANRKRTKLTCEICERVFERTPSQIAKAKHANVCSLECLYKGRSSGLIKRVVEKPYQYTPEGKASMKAAASLPKGKRVYHWLTCAHCGTVFDDPGDGRKRKGGIHFCSLSCCNAYRVGKNNPAWKGGHPKYYGKNWRKLRRDAWERDNYTCQRCNKHMPPPGRRPDVHHIQPVGTFENREDANTLDNVVCLCHSCHMHTENYGIDFEWLR